MFTYGTLCSSELEINHLQNSTGHAKKKPIKLLRTRCTENALIVSCRSVRTNLKCHTILDARQYYKRRRHDKIKLILGLNDVLKPNA